MTLEQQVEEKIAACIPGFEAIPGVVIIHYLDPPRVRYMSSTGLKILGVTLEELQEIGRLSRQIFQQGRCRRICAQSIRLT